jgi:acetyl esterase
MALHPQIAEALKHSPQPPTGPLDPAKLRAAEEDLVPAANGRLPLAAVEDVIAATTTGDVPIRIYTAAESDAYGLLVYLHGGAFFLGSLDTHDHVARSLTQATGLRVLSVGYRRAPENRYPAGLNDCYGVIRWASEHTNITQWDTTTLAVAGDSSGGTFTAAVTALARDEGFDRITAQVLLYPSLDLDFDIDDGRYPSRHENAEGFGLETKTLKPFNAFYRESGADPADPLVSPINRADLTGLPPALIITAEHDPLRDEAELYGRRLQQAGVTATVKRYSGATHGFVQHFGWIPEYHQVFDEIAAFLERPGQA